MKIFSVIVNQLLKKNQSQLYVQWYFLWNSSLSIIVEYYSLQSPEWIDAVYVVTTNIFSCLMHLFNAVMDNAILNIKVTLSCSSMWIKGLRFSRRCDGAARQRAHNSRFFIQLDHTFTFLFLLQENLENFIKFRNFRRQ